MTRRFQPLILAASALLGGPAAAGTLSLSFDNIATNLYGNIGAHPAVATLTVTDLSDILTPAELAVAGEGAGGVRVTIANTGTDQFWSGVAGTTTWIGSFELNFPGTMDTDPNSPDFEAALNGYDSNATSIGGVAGAGNRWANVSGTPLGAGGIEWQEGGATNGWQFFAQEYNFTGTAFTADSLTQGKSSTIDLYNGAGLSNISVAALLSNPVYNATSPGQSAIYSWIKIRGNTSADPTQRGIAASGYWGASASNATSYRLDVVAPVPVPAAFPLFLSAMAALGLIRRRQD